MSFGSMFNARETILPGRASPAQVAKEVAKEAGRRMGSSARRQVEAKLWQALAQGRKPIIPGVAGSNFYGMFGMEPLGAKGDPEDVFLFTSIKGEKAGGVGELVNKHGVPLKVVVDMIEASLTNKAPSKHRKYDLVIHAVKRKDIFK